MPRFFSDIFAKFRTPKPLELFTPLLPQPSRYKRFRRRIHRSMDEARTRIRRGAGTHQWYYDSLYLEPIFAPIRHPSLVYGGPSEKLTVWHSRKRFDVYDVADMVSIARNKTSNGFSLRKLAHLQSALYSMAEYQGGPAQRLLTPISCVSYTIRPNIAASASLRRR